MTGDRWKESLRSLPLVGLARRASRGRLGETTLPNASRGRLGETTLPNAAAVVSARRPSLSL